MAEIQKREPTALIVGPDKKFSNKLQLFPLEIREKIDELVQIGKGSNTCLKWVKANYKGSLEIPSIGTFEAYVKYRREVLASAMEGATKIEQVQAKRLDLTQIPTGDKKAYLDALLMFMAWRVEEVKIINAHLNNPGYERIITDDVRVILDTLMAQMKFEDKMGISKAKVKAVATVLMRYVGPIIQDAFKSVHGEKGFNAFVREIEQTLDKLPMEDIEREALQAFSTED